MSPMPVDPRDVQALGWSLLHFVWQGTAVAALLASLSLVLRRAAPQVRYLLAGGALLLMLLLPITTFFVVRGPAAALRAEGATSVVPEAWSVARSSVVAGEATGVGPIAVFELQRRIEPLLPVLVGLWGLGVLLLSLRSLGGWAVVQRLRAAGLTAPPVALESVLARLMSRLRVSTPVRLYQSALVQVPTVVGWLRPVILLPASALTGLSPEQLALVLAHELSHIRRRDYLANLAQTAVETLLFYHPAVWWVSNRMRVEREHCCDDLAVAAGGNPVRYARTLAELEGLRSSSPALAMAATGGSLFERVARLVAPPGNLSGASRCLAALLVAASLGVAFGGSSILVASPASSSSVVVAPAIPLAPDADPTSSVWVEETTDPQAAEPSSKPRPTAKPQPQAEPRAFPLARVLELAHAGVTPEYIDEMDALGYPSLTAEQLVALRSQGVGPEYVRDLAGAGYAKLSPDQLIMLRAQGVSGSFAGGLKQQGLADLSISDLVELRSQGVSPEFVAEMKQAGYDDLTSAKLIALRSQGVSGRYVTQMKELGYDKLALSKLIALRSQGITPDYVRGLADLGYKGIELPLLIGLRSQGVTPEYVRGLKAAGYEGLPAPLLIELRSQGVTPEFVQELKEAGFDKLKPEELIELRSQGVRGHLLKRLRAHQ
ncbi:MAG: M56 family metallopeptidase [Solirubrobacterales bacterium]|jgi:beta-lactamase regulating signal transducer with metallopeptidase domain